MKTINMHEAKTHLSRVVEEISSTGVIYLICRDGKPVAELRPYFPPADPFETDPELRVVFKEDPASPIDPREWPEAFE